MKRLAVIPARAGSTRLKDKNVYPLAGQPLIRWITRAVVESGCFDKVIVSTDSDKIFSAVQDLNVERHYRPTEHATVKATPLNAMSMTEIPETIQLACVMKENWVMPVFDNLEAGLTNSKFIKKYYKPSGGFHMARWDKLLESKNFFKGNVKGVLIPKERSIDIDDIHDIEMAEQLWHTRYVV